MEFKELKKRDMDLLSRKRVTLLMESTGATPSRHDVIKEVAKKYKTKEELVIIKHIYQQFGSKKVKLIVNLYEDKDKMQRFEHKNLLKKHQEKPKKQEEPAEPQIPQEKTEETSKETESVEEGAKEDKSEHPKEEKTEKVKEEKPGVEVKEEIEKPTEGKSNS